MAGFLFALANLLLPWRATYGGLILAGPLMVLGAALAGRVWSVVERPTRGGVITFVVLAGVVAPAFTGVIDLALRSRTP